jgi:arabinofuranosyltransferase
MPPDSVTLETTTTAGRSWRRPIAAVLLASACAGLYWGWQLHWFLTDDAYIAFRYISNRRLGFGYTWNAPPFVPVEGYTSLGWVMLLDGVWSIFGVEPPDAANAISLAMAMGSLGLTTWATYRLCQAHRTERSWPYLLAALLLALISQRTFLIWASSGLETALFNLLFQAFILVGLSYPVRDVRSARRFAFGQCALASAVTLTRPDGLVVVAAALAILVALALGRRLPASALAACASPLLVVAAQLAYRLHTYGGPLPNTYTAKVVAAWPEAGLRYGAAFVLEYAYYLAVPLWSFGLYHSLRALARDVHGAHGAHADRTEQRRSLATRTSVRALCLAAAGAKLGFDLCIAGGDHFEYRTLSWLVPLALLALAHGLLALTRRTAVVVLAIGVFAASSAILPWTHFLQTRDREVWPVEPRVLPVAPHVPAPLRPIAERFDALQAWLLPRGVGIRHYEHRAFWFHQLREYPSRETGARLCAEHENPVSALATIGVAGWTLARCHILDLRGLTDRVIARAPLAGGPEYLGHDRRPPPEYVRAFKPNVLVQAGRVVFLPRPSPLTDDEITRIEEIYGDPR